MNRRQLLKGLIAAPAVAVAAHFNVPDYMGEEIQEELKKDLLKTHVAMPKEVFDNRPVWRSVKGVEKVWKEHILGDIQKRYSEDAGKALASKIDRTIRQMVRVVDLDLQKAELTNDHKVIIQPPQVTVLRADTDNPVLELRAGLEETTGLFGKKEHRVGYIARGIVDAKGNEL